MSKKKWRMIIYDYNLKTHEVIGTSTVRTRIMTREEALVVFKKYRRDHKKFHKHFCYQIEY